MKRLIKRLSSGKWPNIEPQLLEFEGHLSLVSFAALHSTRGLTLVRLCNVYEMQTRLFAERYELAKILSGKSIDWNDEYLLQNDDDLGKALLKLIWLNGPLNQMNPTTEQMEIGLEILTKEQATANRIDIIRWKMLQSYVDEERSDDALEIIKTISLEKSDSVVQISSY